jgi:hypothetical protein
MANVTVRIDSSGSFSPSSLDAQAGDTVTFSAEADTVLCVAPATVFGAERFVIPAGQEKQLQVQQDIPPSLDFIARVGDLDAPCRSGDRERTSGGGSVGGGPG